ncbi:hypothetical protein [Tahibacter harae]|uniref:Uncharacterized protein n=1 Tax=Tahibacter harae TaxID=2963937 RepID=A0ABT1QN18_9GAMM|nr:hypothetical protein [Tahibacter harae]MCQ4163930.1 hypothetical protein [Tahibacter harae]
MSLRSACLLATAALFCAATAKADLPGQVIWYGASISYSCPTGVSSRAFNEPSYSLCQYRLSQELQDVNNANCEVLEIDPCHVRVHSFSAEEAEGAPLDLSDLVTGGYVREEEALRSRFRIDQFEAELKALRKRLQPVR